MKKVINGKMYNTETAEVIGVANTINDVEFNADMTQYIEKQIDSGSASFYVESSVIEKLYRKNNGEMFIVREFSGDGSDDNEVRLLWVLENRVEPLSEKDAKTWVEKRLSTDTYIDLFGEPEE